MLCIRTYNILYTRPSPSRHVYYVCRQWWFVFRHPRRRQQTGVVTDDGPGGGAGNGTGIQIPVVLNGAERERRMFFQWVARFFFHYYLKVKKTIYTGILCDSFFFKTVFFDYAPRTDV